MPLKCRAGGLRAQNIVLHRGTKGSSWTSLKLSRSAQLYQAHKESSEGVKSQLQDLGPVPIKLYLARLKLNFSCQLYIFRSPEEAGSSVWVK